MNAQDKQHLTELIHSARIVVRDIGYVAQQIEAGILVKVSAHQAYDMACLHLQKLDPTGASEFIRSTYGPAFRQTEVTK